MKHLLFLFLLLLGCSKESPFFDEVQTADDARHVEQRSIESRYAFELGSVLRGIKYSAELGRREHTYHSVTRDEKLFAFRIRDELVKRGFKIEVEEGGLFSPVLHIHW